MECSVRSHGVKKILLGALLLLNVWVWPQWTGLDGWIAWIAVLLVLAGIYLVIAPNSCPVAFPKDAPKAAASAKKRK